MDDGAGDARLVEQHVDELRLVAKFGQQHLDRDVALEAAERLHARAEHLGHAAAADAVDQRVAVERDPASDAPATGMPGVKREACPA